MKTIATLFATLFGLAAFSSCTTYVEDDVDATTTTRTTTTESAYVPGVSVTEKTTTTTYD